MKLETAQLRRLGLAMGTISQDQEEKPIEDARVPTAADIKAAGFGFKRK